MPYVSIIVPVYKVEVYLRQCVDSVLGQTFKDTEVILVDDGSPDGCPQICDDYGRLGSHVKVVHKENGGSASARNAGLQKATGEYVIFVDGDDYWGDADGLRRLVDVAARGTADAVVFGYRKYFETSRSFSSGSVIDEAQVRGKPFLTAMHYLVASRKFMISACNKLLRRSVLVENHILFVPGQLGEDLDWCLRLISCLQTVDAVDTDFYIYRQREGSITKKIKEKNVKDWLGTMTKWCGLMSSTETPPDRRELYFGLLADAYLIMIHLFALLPGIAKKELSHPIKSLDFLLQYKDNSRVRKVALLYSVIRMRGTSLLLYCFIYLKEYLKK